MRYRTEIDGLRAIAVLMVLLFHFFHNAFSQGYLGVDVFFVISGYVITAQIHQQMLSGTFTFLGFFARRVKRILPLVFFVLLVTVVAGYFVLLPADFERMMASAFAVSTFWANVFFWLDGGYFGGADKLKPLLHMWSLSVEEQFYIVFPFLMWVFVHGLRLRSHAVIAALLGLTLASLGIYFFLRSIGGGNPAFFLMPSRAWQFGLGAIAALLATQGRIQTSRIVAELAIVMVFATVFVEIPGLSAEVMIACAVTLYLIFTSGQYRLDIALSHPVAVYIGLRSFSLYVWHWPIVAFLNYAYLDGTPTSVRLGALALCFALSELTFRFVEKPLRYRLRIGYSVALIAASCGTMLAVNSLSSVRSSTSLMNNIAAQIQTNYRCGINEFVPYGQSRACILVQMAEHDNIAILGNSHAQMYAAAIADQVQVRGRGVILVPLNSCMPTVSLNLTQTCLDQAQTNLEAVLEDDSISTVIIGTTYTADRYVTSEGEVISGEAPTSVAAALLDLVDQIAARKDAVFLIGPLLTPGYDLPSFLGRSLRFDRISETDALDALRAPSGEFSAKFGTLITLLETRLGERFIRPDRWLCDGPTCRFGDTGGSYFADSNHLGRYGIGVITPMFKNVH